MNSKTVGIKKDTLSIWLLLAFCLLIAVTTLYSELFQAPLQEFDAKKLASNPIKVELLEGIKSAELTNAQGIFHLERDPDATDLNNDGLDDETRDLAWSMTSPYTNGARAQVLEQIFELLRKLSPKKAFQHEPINLANFTLDKPIFTLKLQTEKGKTVLFSMGLTNNETGTTYVAVESAELKNIYAIAKTESPLGTIGAGSIIDSKIFMGHNSNLDIIEVYKGKELDKDPLLVLLKKDQAWYGANYEGMNAEKVQDFLDKLFSIKSLMILDKVSEEGQEELEKLRLEPEITMILKNRSNSGVAYTISNSVSSLPGVKLDRKSTIIWVSNRTFPYLVGRENLNSIFNVKQNNFD
ncbi:MAG: DUF4340 domain-containing protein [Bacteriovoracaceae bacterium]